jgi:signal transduction histidine kinase
MQPLHADAIDTRFVLRVYAWTTITTALLVYAWPRLLPSQFLDDVQLAGTPGRLTLLRIGAAVIAAAGCCAAAFATVRDPVDRRRGLYGLAIAHFVFGSMFFIQWWTVLAATVPPMVGWTPLLAGFALIYVAVTCTTTPRFRSESMIRLFDGDQGTSESVYAIRTRPEAVDALRSQFEEQIREVARQEERARLARDLHDAVKQQLFVIQTAAATAETRLDGDADGTKEAIALVRASAREAMTEMEAMIAELESEPLENTGLVEALKKQCDALGFRTGADVKLDLGVLPPAGALPHGAHHALFRCAQEALANVGRHARASHVKVTLGANPRHLELTVRDDGAGFDPEVSQRGMGIRNMTSRVGVLGGGFVMMSTPGRGTTVRCSVPYDARTPVEYRTMALIWVAVLGVMGVNVVFGDAWERPWSLAIAVIAPIAIARYVVAYYRTRGRTGTVA